MELVDGGLKIEGEDMEELTKEVWWEVIFGFMFLFSENQETWFIKYYASFPEFIEKTIKLLESRNE